MKHLVAVATVLAFVCAPVAAEAWELQAPLIERAKLFGNPVRANLQVSPDGKWLAWRAPHNGVMNVWAAPVSDPSQAKVLTAEDKRPIRIMFWLPDSRQIMLYKDPNGDGNYQLHSVDVITGAERVFTSFEKTRAELFGLTSHLPDLAFIGLNNRDSRWHDPYILNLKSGELKRVFLNDGGFVRFSPDYKFNLRLAMRKRSDGGWDVFRFTNGKAEDKPFTTIAPEDAQATGPLDYTVDGTKLYWLDSRGRNAAALLMEDVQTGKVEVIAEEPNADVSNLQYDIPSGRMIGYSSTYMKRTWKPIGPLLKEDFAFLSANLNGEITIISRSDDSRIWTLQVDPVTEPPALYLHDSKTKTLKKLFVMRPELEGAPLVPMHPREIKTRDGQTEIAYFSLPPGSDSNADGIPDRPVPMVVVVHGGPWNRDTYGFNATHQWLANRGYAVLSVNFRGSGGLGKAWLSAGDREWGGKMQDDLADAVAWAVQNGIARKDKVAIMGTSYGGYATLAGLSFTPGLFACGVEIAGPSNLETFLSTVPTYWQGHVGDPRTPEGQKLLHDRSPLYKADQIKKPLLIGQGANDPRVNQRESDQIVKVMADKGIPVTYVLFPDEGHGFARQENNIAFNAIAEQFLAKNLGGRAEPIGDAVKKSTAQVPHGAEFTPGLKDALVAK